MLRQLLFSVFTFMVFASSAQEPMQLKFPVVPQDFYSKVEFSNDGKLILFSEHSRTYLVDAVTYKTVFYFKNTTKSNFSPDGNYILNRYSNQLEIWDIASQKNIYSFPIKSYPDEALLTADSKFLVMSLSDNSWPVRYQLVGIDLASKKEMFRSEASSWILSISNDVKSKFIANYGYSGKATVYNQQNGAPLYTISVATDSVRSLRFSPDDKLIAVAAGAAINLYNAETGKLVKALNGHAANVTCASFSKDGKKIISSSLDKTIRIWNINSGKMEKEFTEEDPVYNVDFSPKDNYMIAEMEYGWLNIRNIATGKKHNPGFLGIAAKYGGPRSISPDEQLYYTQSKIIKLANAETVYEFKQQIFEINTAEVSPNGRYMATIKSMNSNVSIWDMSEGKMIADFGFPDTSRYVMFAMDLKFSSDNKSLFVAWNNGDLWQWDLESNKVGNVVRTQKNVSKLLMNQSRDQILAISDSSVTALSTASLQKLFQFKSDSLSLSTYIPVVYSPDEKLLLLNGGSNAQVVMLDAKTGTIYSQIKKENGAGIPLITADNKKLVMVFDNDPAYVYDLKTGEQLRKSKHVWGSTQSANAFINAWVELDPKEPVLYSFATGNYPTTETYFQKWNFNTGEFLSSIPFPAFDKCLFDGSGTFLTLTKDSVTLRDEKTLKALVAVEAKNVLLDSVNKRIYVQTEYAMEICSYDLKKLMTVASFGEGSGISSPYSSSGGLIVLADNYYKADPAAIGKIHFQNGLNVIGVNQLDVILNRPDKVMQALGSKDTTLITAYTQAYEKRLKKLELTTKLNGQKTTPPVAEITNKNKIPSEQLGKNIVLNVSASDKETPLDRYNVWVNDVPLFGAKGADLSRKNAKNYNGAITVPLSNGANHIEFAVINKNGIESYRQPINVFQGTKKTIDETQGYQAYNANAPKEGTVYFIGIGIDKFREVGHDLKWSVKDIRDLVENLSKKNYQYDIVIDTLFNEQVTTNNIVALKKKLQNTSVNDKVIVSYSGHGLLSKDYDYYLSTYEVNFKKPEEGGLPYDALESLLDNIPARKKLMLIDACHSGEVDKEEMMNYARSGVKVDGGKGGEVLNVSPNAKVGMKNSFELMKELFGNVGKSTGATIISAAAGTQLALEGGGFNNGYFTYSILELMKKDGVTVSELKQYVNKRVIELSNGLQQPTTRSENKVADWKVWE